MALCDLESNINLMPLYLADRLVMHIGEPKATTIKSLVLGTYQNIYPWGIIEDVPVKVNDLLISVDFVVIDTNDDEEIPLLLGKQFLATSSGSIKVENEELVLRTDEKEEAHLEEEEEEVMEETSYARDEDFFGALESQPKHIEEQDDSLIEHFSNRANASEESKRQPLMKEDQDKLLPNYDSQLENIMDKFLKTNQACFRKFEAQCKNLVEKKFFWKKRIMA
jgi:hypothetical protein